jgi:hypothetical protein
MHTTRMLAVVVLVIVIATPIAAQKTPDLTPYLIADRAAEVALARSAAPRNVSDSATVLVMTRSGLVEAAHGSNGFTCFVLRSFDAGIGDPNFWNPGIRAPHCLNPPASRTILPEMKKRVEWIMAGVSPTEIDARTKRAYATHEFPMPETGAMAYMLSPQQHLADGAHSHWLPHLMFYYDKSIPAAALGAGGMKAPVIDATADDPSAPLLTLFIPVRQWSDSTPASGN